MEASDRHVNRRLGLSAVSVNRRLGLDLSLSICLDWIYMVPIELTMQRLGRKEENLPGSRG